MAGSTLQIEPVTKQNRKEKYKMRRCLLLTVLLVMAVSFTWIGCGNSGDTTDNNGNNPPSSDNPKMTIETDKGNIVIELFPDSAPNTVDHISDLVDQQFYDKMMINRVQANVVIQMGDPGCRKINAPVFPVGECDLSGGSGTTVALEKSPNLTHKRGTVSMAHPGDGNGDSQFFICLNTSTCQQLDSQSPGFTIFGQVTSGSMDVVDQISCDTILQEGENGYIGKCVPGTGVFMNRVTVSDSE